MVFPDQSTVQLAIQVVRLQLTQKTLPSVILGLDKELQTLKSVIAQTVSFGQSNSIVIVGPRDSGKSLLLRRALADLQKEKLLENMLPVQLNGLIQTDDKIAIQEIARQLNLENLIGENVIGTFAENLQLVLKSLKQGDGQCKVILFTLDEFDLFTQHKNQTLLYNLFDVAQSAQAPVCVIGMTTRLDIMELLEKRVKSRFSHRQLFIVNSLTFEQYLQVFEANLSLSENFPNRKFRDKWNCHVQALRKESLVLDTLRNQYKLDPSVRKLQMLLALPISKVTCETPYPSATHMIEAAQRLSLDSKASMIQGVSILELMLLIAMKHLDEVLQGEPFNFEMLYNEYHKFAQKRSSSQILPKPVVLKAFEHLCALELVRPVVDSLTSRTQKEYRLIHLQIDSGQLLEALQKYPNCPTEVHQWANSGIN